MTERSKKNADEFRKLSRLVKAIAQFCEQEVKLSKPVINVLDYQKNTKSQSEDPVGTKTGPLPVLFKSDLDFAKPKQHNPCVGAQGEVFRFKRGRSEAKPKLQKEYEHWKKVLKGKETRGPNDGEDIPPEIDQKLKQHEAMLADWRASNVLPAFYSALHKLYYSPGTDKSVTLGIGMLRSKSLKINHPLIELKLDIGIDSQKSDILLWQTDSDPTFWNFSGVSFAESGELHQNLVNELRKAATSMMEKCAISPFDSSTYMDILSCAKDKLSSSMQKIESHLDVDVKGALPDDMQIVDTWAIYQSCPSIHNAVKRDCDSLEQQFRENPMNCPTWALRFVRSDCTSISDDDRRGEEKSSEDLFPLDCNREQADILDKLKDHTAVVVRGPPGTGKTHTVANMICHFLAVGKRVLVVSDGPEALKVLWKKVKDAVPALEDLAVLWPTLKEAVEQLAKVVPNLSTLGQTQMSPKDNEAKERAIRDKRVCERRIKAIDFKFLKFAELRLKKLSDEISRKDVDAKDGIPILQSMTLRTKLVEIVQVLDHNCLDYTPEELFFTGPDGQVREIVTRAKAAFRSDGGDDIIPTDELLQCCKAISESGMQDFVSACRLLEEKCSIICSLPKSSEFPPDWQFMLIIRCVEGYLSSLNKKMPSHNDLKERRGLEIELRTKHIRTEVAVKARSEVRERFSQHPALPSKLQELLNTLNSVNSSRKQNSGAYLARAKELLKDLSLIQAFPLWIMPVAKVSDVLPCELGLFDLVILDEASQSGISCLPVLLRGKRILVIGDEQQVSPGDHSPNFDEEVKRIQHELLDGFPYQNLSCALPIEGNSIFDLCVTAFSNETCTLREHFRCVRDIIQFSSTQFYNGNLIAVRCHPRFKFDKTLKIQNIEHGKREKEKNHAEATAIVREVEKIISNAERKGGACPSIGVISLWGSRQAQLIDDLLKASTDVGPLYDKYKIKCGDAFDFQGDERDIIFTSMVADSKSRPVPEDGLRMKRNNQNYNVAASRARDCLHLFCSSPPRGKSEDIRQRFIAHFGQQSQDEAAFDVWKKSCLGLLSVRLEALNYRVRFMSQRQRNEEKLAVLIVEDDVSHIGFVPMGAIEGEVKGIAYWNENFQYSLILTRAEWKLYFLWMSQIESCFDDCLKGVLAALQECNIQPMPKAVGASETKRPKKAAMPGSSLDGGSIRSSPRPTNVPMEEAPDATTVSNPIKGGILQDTNKTGHAPNRNSSPSIMDSKSTESESRDGAAKEGKKRGPPVVEMVEPIHRTEFTGKHFAKILDECLNATEVKEVMKKCLDEDPTAFKSLHQKSGRSKEWQLNELSQCRPSGHDSAADLLIWLADMKMITKKQLQSSKIQQKLGGSTAEGMVKRMITQFRPSEEELNRPKKQKAGGSMTEETGDGEQDAPGTREVADVLEVQRDTEQERRIGGTPMHVNSNLGHNEEMVIDDEGYDAQGTTSKSQEQSRTGNSSPFGDDGPTDTANKGYDPSELESRDRAAKEGKKRGPPVVEMVEPIHRTEFTGKHFAKILDECLNATEVKEVMKKCLDEDPTAFKSLHQKSGRSKEWQLNELSQCRPSGHDSAADLLIWLADMKMITKKQLQSSKIQQKLGGSTAEGMVKRMITQFRPSEEELNRPKKQKAGGSMTEETGDDAPDTRDCQDAKSAKGEDLPADEGTESDSSISAAEDEGHGGIAGASVKKEAPKKPSAYILFCIDRRQMVVEANPGIAFPEIGKELGKLWNALPDGEKQTYKERERDAMARYNEEKAAFDAENPGGPAPKRRRKGAEDLQGKSKKPTRPSAYRIFCDESRTKFIAESPGISANDLYKAFGAAWKALPEAEKKVFQDKEAALMPQYEKAKTQYEADNPRP